MPDENLAIDFEKLSVSKVSNAGLGKQRLVSNSESQYARNPLKGLQLQQQSTGTHRPPSMLIRKASIDRMHRIPSVVRKPSMDRTNSINSASASGASGSSVLHKKKPSMDSQSRQPSVIRKGSLDGLSVNLNTNRAVNGSGASTASTSSSISTVTSLKGPTRHVDIGTYDGSLERDEKRGRRSNDVRGGLLDLDARQ